MSISFPPKSTTALKWTARIISVAVFFVGLSVVATVFNEWPGTQAAAQKNSLRTTLQIDHPILAEGVPAGVRFEGTVTTAPIGPDKTKQAWALISDIVPELIGLATLILAGRLIKRIRSDNPFDNRNVRTIRQIGGLLILATAASIGCDFIRVYLITHSGLVPLLGAVDYNANFYWLAAGLGVLVVAEIFRRGVELQSDLEGTV